MMVVIAALSLSLLVSGMSVEHVSVEPSLKSSAVAIADAVEPLWFTVEGLVYREINFTYAELEGFPMVSEVAELHCVGSGNGAYGPSIIYNWTGVPLFYLLNMAGVMPGAYRKVVFNTTDGFSDSLLLDTAMDPTTLLGLKANGTDLRQLSGFGSDYRIVLPGRWGYKWVKLIKQIVVVDYNYNGTYENYGLSDPALRPNASTPQTNPPTTDFAAFGYENNPIKVLTNSTIETFKTYRGKQLTFNITGQHGTLGYFYVIISKHVLKEQYYVWVDQKQTPYTLTMTNDFAYLWFTYTHSRHTIEIEGSPVVSLISGGGACNSRRTLT